MKKSFVLFNLVFLIISCGNSKIAIDNSTSNKSSEVELNQLENTEAIEKPTKLEIAPTSNNPSAENSEKNQVLKPKFNQAFNHKAFNDLLLANVTETGIVDYKGFIQNKKRLEDYISSLGESLPSDTWTKEDKLAYWMNAYNAMTIDLIIRNYPLKSIKDLDKPWDQRLWKLGDKWYNLNEIEHQILRKMDEPRIHFGINCASFSCPPLLNEAFDASKVDTQLNILAFRFINDPKRNSISEMNVEISEIFSWFAKDFKKDGSLFEFLNKYSVVQIDSKAKKEFKKYDWTLNE